MDSGIILVSFHQRFPLRFPPHGIVPLMQLGRDQKLVVSGCAGSRKFVKEIVLQGRRTWASIRIVPVVGIKLAYDPRLGADVV